MRRHKFSILIVLLLLGQFTTSCDLDVKEIGYPRGKGVYAFDPQTVFAALARGETDVFVPQAAAPQPGLEGDLPPVRWTQADFYSLLRAFHATVWQEPLENWSLNDLFFALDCADTNLGLQWFSVELYRTAPAGAEGYDDGYDSRFERHIFINPRQGTIEWWETRIAPNMRSRPALDLDAVQVTAEQALQIAERHGGEAGRLAAGNACQIRVTVVGGLRDGDWQVDYDFSGSPLVIQVDAQTGAYQVIPEGK
jgi:hypothetical protein